MMHQTATLAQPNRHYLAEVSAFDEQAELLPGHAPAHSPILGQLRTPEGGLLSTRPDA